MSEEKEFVVSSALMPEDLKVLLEGFLDICNTRTDDGLPTAYWLSFDIITEIMPEHGTGKDQDRLCAADYPGYKTAHILANLIGDITMYKVLFPPLPDGYRLHISALAVTVTDAAYPKEQLISVVELSRDTVGDQDQENLTFKVSRKAMDDLMTRVGERSIAAQKSEAGEKPEFKIPDSFEEGEVNETMMLELMAENKPIFDRFVEHSMELSGGMLKYFWVILQLHETGEDGAPEVTYEGYEQVTRLVNAEELGRDLSVNFPVPADVTMTARHVSIAIRPLYVMKGVRMYQPLPLDNVEEMVVRRNNRVLNVIVDSKSLYGMMKDICNSMPGFNKFVGSVVHH